MIEQLIAGHQHACCRLRQRGLFGMCTNSYIVCIFLALLSNHIPGQSFLHKVVFLASCQCRLLSEFHFPIQCQNFTWTESGQMRAIILSENIPTLDTGNFVINIIRLRVSFRPTRLQFNLVDRKSCKGSIVHRILLRTSNWSWSSQKKDNKHVHTVARTNIHQCCTHSSMLPDSQRAGTNIHQC